MEIFPQVVVCRVTLEDHECSRMRHCQVAKDFLLVCHEIWTNIWHSTGRESDEWWIWKQNPIKLNTISTPQLSIHLLMEILRWNYPLFFLHHFSVSRRFEYLNFSLHLLIDNSLHSSQLSILLLLPYTEWNIEADEILIGFQHFTCWWCLAYMPSTADTQIRYLFFP